MIRHISPLKTTEQLKERKNIVFPIWGDCMKTKFLGAVHSRESGNLVI